MLKRCQVSCRLTFPDARKPKKAINIDVFKRKRSTLIRKAYNSHFAAAHWDLFSIQTSLSMRSNAILVEQGIWSVRDITPNLNWLQVILAFDYSGQKDVQIVIWRNEVNLSSLKWKISILTVYLDGFDYFLHSLCRWEQFLQGFRLKEGVWRFRLRFLTKGSSILVFSRAIRSQKITLKRFRTNCCYLCNISHWF